MRFQFQCQRPWQAAAALAAVALVGISSAAKANDYSESAIGDFSNDNLAPTPITLSLGANIITGSTLGDNDYMTFTIPVGEVLSQIVVLNAAQAPDRTFFGIASGSKVVVDPSFSSAAGLIGWTLFNNSMDYSDVLPDLGKAAPADFPSVPGATGFTGPLSHGVYTTWLLDGDNLAHYSLDFQVAGVPEPASWALMISGFGFAGATLRRRRRSLIA